MNAMEEGFALEPFRMTRFRQLARKSFPPGDDFRAPEAPRGQNITQSDHWIKFQPRRLRRTCDTCFSLM